MIEIKQAWFHIEDFIKPSDGKQFRQVMDIYTDEDVLKVDFNKNFVKLKVINRYNSNELGFIENSGYICIKLGDLSNWPSAGIPDNLKLRHIKLEIQYTDVKPEFDEKLMGYESPFIIEGPTQPEFYVTVPRGMKLKKKGKDTTLLLSKLNKKDNTVMDIPLKFNENLFIGQKDGKRTYNFLISEKSYTDILSTPSKDILGFIIHYEVTHQSKFYFVPGFAALMFAIGILEFIKVWDVLTYNDFQGSPLINLTYIIIIISFTTYFLTLLKEGYEIPFSKAIAVSIPLVTLLLLFSPQLIWIIHFILSFMGL